MDEAALPAFELRCPRCENLFGDERMEADQPSVADSICLKTLFMSDGTSRATVDATLSVGPQRDMQRVRCMECNAVVGHERGGVLIISPMCIRGADDGASGLGKRAREFQLEFDDDPLILGEDWLFTENIGDYDFTRFVSDSNAA